MKSVVNGHVCWQGISNSNRKELITQFGNYLDGYFSPTIFAATVSSTPCLIERLLPVPERFDWQCWLVQCLVETQSRPQWSASRYMAWLATPWLICFWEPSMGRLRIWNPTWTEGKSACLAWKRSHEGSDCRRTHDRLFRHSVRARWECNRGGKTEEPGKGEVEWCHWWGCEASGHSRGSLRGSSLEKGSLAWVRWPES